MMKPINIALDISTTCIGISVFTIDGELIDLKHLILKNNTKDDVENRYLTKADTFKEYIQKFKDFEIANIIIEEPLIRSNNVYTANLLLRFNGICSFLLYQELGVKPTFLTVHEIRKHICPELVKVEKGKEVLKFGDIDKKVYIHKKVSSWFPQITWFLDKKGNLKKENYDMSDSMAINLAFLLKNKTIKYSEIGKLTI